MVVCVLEVCTARDSPLANTVRQRLHNISSAEKWTSRDHDLSRTLGRRSALTNLELVRPDHAVFFPPCSGFNVPISNGRRSNREKYIVYSCSLLVQKQLSFGDAHVVVECTSDSLIPKFLRVMLGTFWRARIELCMHGLVQPQTQLPLFRSVFVYTSSRLVFEALDRRCDGHCGLPHAGLSSESVRYVSFLPKKLVDLFEKIMVKLRMALAAAMHNSAQPRAQEGVEGEKYYAPRRPEPPLRGKRPAPLEEVAEQEKLASHSSPRVPASGSPSTPAAQLEGAPLPDSIEWVQLRERHAGKTYYWNRCTNSTVWQAPAGVEVVWIGERNEGRGVWYWHGDTRVTAFDLLSEGHHRQPRAVYKYWAPCRLCCVEIFFSVYNGH